MSDSEGTSEEGKKELDYSSTSWIYALNKQKVIETLAKCAKSDPSLEFDDSDSLDILRKILSKHIKEKHQQSTSSAKNVTKTAKTEDKSKIIKSASKKIKCFEMATNNNVLTFKLGEDDWEMYTERLELYFEANDIEDEKQVAVLLTKISPDTYKLVRNLCAPQKPKEKTFAQLVKLVTDHLCPKPSETMERCKFKQVVQGPTEIVSDFVARLKNAATHCNFGNGLEMALRDQLVCGLREHTTRALLFREETLTFESALKLSLAAETAEKNASSTRDTPTSSSADVHAISDNRNWRGQQNWPVNRGRGGNRGRGRGRGRQTTFGNDRRPSESRGNCFCCGFPNHLARNCFHRFDTCTKCHVRGHIARACRSSRDGNIQQLEADVTASSSGEANETDEGAVDVNWNYEDDFLVIQGGAGIANGDASEVVNNIRADPMALKVTINGRELLMEVDTGAYIAAISKATKDALFPLLKIEELNKSFNAYGKVKIDHEGVIKGLNVVFQGKQALLDLVVMTRPGPTLIGRQWLQALGLWPLDFARNNLHHDVYHLRTENVPEMLMKKFPVLFGPGVGCYNKGTLKLVLRENAQPVAMKARKLPFALMPKVEREIDRLESLGHLEKVDISEWATPIVPIIKKDGSVRICGNFKITVNPQLIIDRHPLPLIDEIFAALSNGDTFSQIDLKHAYMQIPIDETARDLLTIITHKGLYRYKKLTEGIASGPGGFQRIMEQCLMGIKGCIAYLDNVFVTGKNTKEHCETLHAVCRRLEQFGFKVTVQKCDFFKKQLNVLGYVIDKNGLHKAKDKIRAMVEAPRPQNFKELSSFIGLITYYARFLPNRAEKLRALYDCGKQSEFCWTAECDAAFQWVKSELTSSRVLAHYDPKEQLVLACDASNYGLSAVLSHKYKDGSERPIAFASQIIPEKERHRAPIDKEASAIVFGFKRFYNFVYGQNIILRTDHKPLIFIFGPKQEIPLTTASRLQRWAYYLSRFNYNIEYIKSSENGNCDALSRLPIQDALSVFDDEYSALDYVSESIETVNAATVARETKKDDVLKKVALYLQTNWPATHDLSDAEKAIFSKRDELIVEKGCILWGNRVLVPEKLRKEVLEELHVSHFGIVKMKMIARSYVWWPGIDREIESVAASCAICVRERKAPPSVPLNPWPMPSKVWSRIHCDFLGPLHGHMFMVIVDAYSKWPEAIDMNTCTTSARVISELRKIFARFGFARHLVTDNGRQFTSLEFKDFVLQNGMKHSFTAPSHPATNGAAEKFVETFKDKVKKIVSSGRSLEYAVSLFLFDYRATEHCTTGRSPASVMFKRELRTRFDLLRPQMEDTVETKQLAQVKAKGGSRREEFEIGDDVMVDDFSVRSDKRKPGKIVRKLSPVTYEVNVGNDCIWKRHVDQIVRFETGEKNEVRRSERLRKRKDV